jgi:hypothetical protein
VTTDADPLLQNILTIATGGPNQLIRESECYYNKETDFGTRKRRFSLKRHLCKLFLKFSGTTGTSILYGYFGSLRYYYFKRKMYRIIILDIVTDVTSSNGSFEHCT